MICIDAGHPKQTSLVGHLWICWYVLCRMSFYSATPNVREHSLQQSNLHGAKNNQWWHGDWGGWTPIWIHPRKSNSWTPWKNMAVFWYLHPEKKLAMTFEKSPFLKNRKYIDSNGGFSHCHIGFEGCKQNWFVTRCGRSNFTPLNRLLNPLPKQLWWEMERLRGKIFRSPVLNIIQSNKHSRISRWFIAFMITNPILWSVQRELERVISCRESLQPKQPRAWNFTAPWCLSFSLLPTLCWARGWRASSLHSFRCPP